MLVVNHNPLDGVFHIIIAISRDVMLVGLSRDKADAQDPASSSRADGISGGG